MGIQIQEGHHQAVGYHQKDDCQVDYVHLVQPDKNRGVAFQNEVQQEIQGYAWYGEQALLAEISFGKVLLPFRMSEQTSFFGNQMKNAPAKEVYSYRQGKDCNNFYC